MMPVKKELNMPVYNEEAIIAKVLTDWLNELSRLGINFELHIYNDGSKDKTLNIVNKLSENDFRVKIHNKTNSGHGPTIIQGYQENSDAEWIFQIDSDDELASVSFEKLWAERKEYDILLGSRIGRVSFLSRRILSLVSRLSVRFFYGKGIDDVNSPYRLMRYEKFRDYFNKIPKNTFTPNVIISGVACMDKLRIFVHPVLHKNRLTGTVSLKRWKLAEAGIRSFFQIILFRFRIFLGR
jgi:glycosyltransferase involved in cell wall biosynthesis